MLSASFGSAAFRLPWRHKHERSNQDALWLCAVSWWRPAPHILSTTTILVASRQQQMSAHIRAAHDWNRSHTCAGQLPGDDSVVFLRQPWGGLKMLAGALWSAVTRLGPGFGGGAQASHQLFASPCKAASIARFLGVFHCGLDVSS